MRLRNLVADHSSVSGWRFASGQVARRRLDTWAARQAANGVTKRQDQGELKQVRRPVAARASPVSDERPG